MSIGYSGQDIIDPTSRGERSIRTFRLFCIYSEVCDSGAEGEPGVELAIVGGNNNNSMQWKSWFRVVNVRVFHPGGRLSAIGMS
jgi:hypothetical protein